MYMHVPMIVYCDDSGEPFPKDDRHFSQLFVVLEEIATFATFFIFTNYFATFPQLFAEKHIGGDH